jgi:hypothetical protein
MLNNNFSVAQGKAEKVTYKVHCRNFRSNPFENRPSIGIRYACNDNFPVVHNKPENLIETSLGELCHRDAGRSPNTVCSSAFESVYTEWLMSLSELLFFIPKPPSASIAEVFVVLGVAGGGHSSRSVETSS